jgi:general bacterial porin, GBP family
MRKTIAAFGVFALSAGAAHAQSSVTLYGLIDAGITYVNNSGGHSLYQATSGAQNSSRWGLRGAEDLGGGLKAIFTLENGFSITNGTLGQQGREFGRQAFVGLSSDQYGAVTLGRQYDDMVQELAPLSLTGTQDGGTFFAHPFDNDNLNNTFRVNNSLRYSSPNFGGFKFGATYGFSNAAGQFSNNRAYSFGATYAYGGFNFAAAYLQLDSSANALTSSTLNTGGAITDAPFAAGLQRTFGAGVNYSFGKATAGFVFTQTKLENVVGNNENLSSTTLPAGSNLRFDNYEVNARYQLTPAMKLIAMYTYTDGKLNNASPSWHTVGLIADYYLSKRTDVYLDGNFQHVNADGVPGLGAELNLFVRPSSTPNQVAVTAGLRHRF